MSLQQRQLSAEFLKQFFLHILNEVALETFEKQMMFTIEKLNKIEELFLQHKRQTQKIETLMLIGETGVGKSTIFNWINGAEFEFKKIGNSKQSFLHLKDPSNPIYSKQSEGMESITKEPKFYLNKTQNHLVVDFPGFKDTNGPEQQFFIKLMFHRLVKQSELKLAIVVNNPYDQLINRGMNIVEIIKGTFKSENAKFTSISLIINQYMDELDDIELEENIRSQLIEIRNQCQNQNEKDILFALQQNIVIIRKVQTQYNMVDEIFNEQTRKRFWNNISKTKPILLNSCNLDHPEKINKYFEIRIDQCFKLSLVKIKNSFQFQIKSQYTEQEVQDIVYNQRKKVQKLEQLINQLQRTKYQLNISLENIFFIIDSLYPCLQEFENFKIILKYFQAYSFQLQCYTQFNYTLTKYLTTIQQIFWNHSQNLQNFTSMFSIQKGMKDLLSTTQKKYERLQDQMQSTCKRIKRLRQENTSLYRNSLRLQEEQKEAQKLQKEIQELKNQFEQKNKNYQNQKRELLNGNQQCNIF